MGYLVLLKFLSKNFWIWEEGYTYITRKFDCALTSLNHNHRYLALKQFIGNSNRYGFWSYKGIIFSIHGNTAKTIPHLINTSDRGLSAKQLEQITAVMCRGILLKLLKQGEIARIKESFDYIYLSHIPEIKRAQLENRGLTSQEHSVEVKTQKSSEVPEEIHSFFDKDRGACAYQEQSIPKEN